MNHPAGRIGKRLILRVHDVMLTGSSLPLISPDELIMEVSTSRLQLAYFLLFPCCWHHASMMSTVRVGHANLA